MPHQCTNCGRTFADGSKEMLSGCPECGGNKFQFRPEGAGDQPSAGSASATGSTAVDTESTAVDAESTADAAAAERDQANSTRPPSRAEESEDGAQASARSDVVSKDELAAAADSNDVADPSEGGADTVSPTGGDAAAEENADTDAADRADPNLDALRQKLNDQFESIRIVSPGKYELNLMELYDREEYIISLREDGRYVIEMPEGWDDR